MAYGDGWIEVGGRRVGEGGRVFVIGEVGQAHEGSLGMAHAYVDLVAKAGADAVKFQVHIAEAESSTREEWRVKFSYEDETRFDYWRRMEFTEGQWRELKEHAEERGLVFLASPFSEEAVEMLGGMGVRDWKIASGEVDNPLLFKSILSKDNEGGSVLLSSGMSGWGDLDAAVRMVREVDVGLGVFQCTTKYPCEAEEVGLNVLGEMRERYGEGLVVGLSDHSGEIWPGVAGVAGVPGWGVSMIEVHVVMSKDAFGPDVGASLTGEGLAELVRGVRYVERMKRAKVDKDGAAEGFGEMRRLFGKSLVARRVMKKGEVVGKEDLAGRKPGDGIPVRDWEGVVGRRLVRDVEEGKFFEDGDFVS